MRITVLEEDINKAIEQVMAALKTAMDKHGMGAFASPCEALGVLTEEYHEVIIAVRENDATNFKEELSDMSASCIFAIASKNAFNRIKRAESGPTGIDPEENV